jgi:hypothetical protein
MRVTDATREAFAYRRFARQALDDGFEPISENGSPLWRFVRGSWIDRQIVEARVAPGGVEVWIKHAPRSPAKARPAEDWRQDPLEGAGPVEGDLLPADSDAVSAAIAR